MKQSAFAQALLDPDAAVPEGVVGPDGRPDAKRFAVYRNNVASSLTRALEAAFPVVQKLVGTEFFGAMAQIYLRAHPPLDRRLMLYGQSFPAFLEGFPPVAQLGYLPDVARLEQAMRESYHAADSMPIAPDALAQLGEAQLLQARLHLAPSVRILASAWPVHAIWLANTQGGPAPVMQAQELVILRPAFDPTPHLLGKGGAAFLAALIAGRPLIQALAATDNGFDLAAVLGLLLQNQALVGVSP